MGFGSNFLDSARVRLSVSTLPRNNILCTGEFGKVANFDLGFWILLAKEQSRLDRVDKVNVFGMFYPVDDPLKCTAGCKAG